MNPRLCPNVPLKEKEIHTYMQTISNLTNKKNKLIADATQLVQSGMKTPELKERHKEMLAELDSVQEHLDMLAQIERAMPNLPAPVPAPVVAAPAVITQRDSAEHRSKVNAAARQFFRYGVGMLSNEQRDLLTTSNTTGGALVNQGFDEAFIEASRFYGNIYNLINRKDSAAGEPTKFVVADGTNQTFSLLTQGTTSAKSVSQTPTMFSDITDTDTLISSTAYSVQETNDAFDLTSFLIRIFGLAVGRARETAITLGRTNDGASTILPNASGGFLSSVSAGITQTAGTLAAGPTYAQLSALAGSVDRSYYQTGSFMASPSVETFLRGQVSTTGKPLYKVDPDTGLLTIAGRVLYPNAAMPAAGTPSAPLVLFGDYSKAWNIQAAPVGLKVITSDGNPNLNHLTRELVVWMRLGQSAGLSNAVKSLVSAAS